HLAGALVTEHGGYGDRDRAVHSGEVGVADAGGLDADAHLARADRRSSDVVTAVETLVAHVVKDGCLHASSSCLRASARFGHESTASRTLPRMSSGGYS